MMTIPDSISIFALLMANALLLGAATLAILKFQRQLASSARFWESPAGDALQAKDEQESINRRMEERLAALQAAIDSIDTDHREWHPPSTEKLPFDNAVRMARAGASVEDLIRTCGLSKGEARLFMRVHARSAA